ncbi:peptide chain release factor N(5)-glutamine methyltransferase [bacterium]|nr:peptide chain release factor N(5)-glutamine methyltransferase [bacterium]
MQIQDLKQLIINAGIEKNEASIELKMLLEHFCNYTEKDLILGKPLSDNDINIIKEKISERINNRTPIQYIIGEAWFMGNKFKVSPDVLIPRDETELLVTRAIEIINNNSFLDVLDIGTGSGCIACTIAKNTQATVLGIDISSDALRIALDNVTKLGINNRAIFRKSNLYEKIRDGEKFDVIISNPPYIPFNTELSLEVQKEPALALFADKNGLSFYETIIKNAPQFLNEDGYIMFELGINQSSAVKEMMEQNFEEITIEKDFANIDRVIYGKLKNI